MLAETTYRLAFFILLAGLVLMRAFFTLRLRRSGGRFMPDQGAMEREGGRGFFFLRVAAFLGVIVLLVLYFLNVDWLDAFFFPLPEWLRWSGVALGILSLAFWIWTQAVLDEQWSPQLQLQQNHRLITQGPYARIRHPLYTAMFGWCAAVALLTANFIFIVFCAVAIAGLIARVPKEEQMMLDAFGDEYKAYMQQTGRFVPKL